MLGSGGGGGGGFSETIWASGEGHFNLPSLTLVLIHRFLLVRLQETLASIEGLRIPESVVKNDFYSENRGAE